MAQQSEKLESHLSAQDHKLDEIHGMLKTLSEGSADDGGRAMQLFRLIDTNGDGALSPDELMVALLGKGMEEPNPKRREDSFTLTLT